MGKMKIKLLVLLTLVIFLGGCAGISLKSQTTEVVIDIGAATIGYAVGQNNLKKIPEWNEWIDKILALKPGISTVSYEKLLAKGFQIICDSPFSGCENPFLEMQFKKLLKLLEFPEIQPPELPFLKEEYINLVKIVMGGFRDGLVAAQAEAKS